MKVVLGFASVLCNSLINTLLDNDNYHSNRNLLLLGKFKIRVCQGVAGGMLTQFRVNFAIFLFSIFSMDQSWLEKEDPKELVSC